MKQPRGAISRTVGAVAQSIADATRRRGEREPRVLVYDDAGHPKLLREDDPKYDGLVDTARRLIGAVGAPPQLSEPPGEDDELALRDDPAGGDPFGGGAPAA